MKKLDKMIKNALNERLLESMSLARLRKYYFVVGPATIHSGKRDEAAWKILVELSHRAIANQNKNLINTSKEGLNIK